MKKKPELTIKGGEKVTVKIISKEAEIDKRLMFIIISGGILAFLLMIVALTFIC